MSIAMIQEFKRSGLPPTDRLVAFMLADHHNDATGRCDPSVALLCEETGLSERAVRYAIRRIAGAGHMTILPRGGTSSAYKLHPTPAPRAPLHEMHPCTTCTPTPAPRAPHPCTTCTPPLHHVHPNHKEPEENRNLNRERALRAMQEVEIPPVTLEAAKANAGQYGATPEIAERWWLNRDAANWIDGKRRQIVRWGSDLQGYSITWRAKENEAKRPAANGHGKPMPGQFDKIAPDFAF